MYRCTNCNKLSKPREKINKVVLQTRKKDYFDSKTGKQVGTGFEIVKETGYCTKCSSAQK